MNLKTKMIVGIFKKILVKTENYQKKIGGYERLDGDLKLQVLIDKDEDD